MKNSNILKTATIGAIGGVIGILSMDIIITIEFIIMKIPITTYLLLMGSVFGGVLFVGVVVHVMIGLIFGPFFVFITDKIETLRITSIKKGAFLGFLYGLISIPLGCIPFAFIVEQPLVKFLSFSSLPHIVWGLVLGIVVGYRLYNRN